MNKYDFLEDKIVSSFPQGSVEPTEEVISELINGETKNLRVYRVNLDRVYLNDENGRIASFINDYKKMNGNDSLLKLRETNIEVYNEQIQNFIENAEDKDNLNETIKNIAMVGQRRAGLILLDGRVIDGNRRVTCLRKLFKEKQDEKFKWFKTVIIDRSLVSKEEIRRLEINRQHAEMRPTEFNTVDMLLSIYKDINEYHISIEDYANTLRVNPRDIEEKLETANLMFEFLEFINAANNFHIIRSLDIIATLRECAAIIKRGLDDDEKETIKNILFTVLFVNPSNSNKRDLERNIKTVIQSPNLKDKFIHEGDKLVENFQDILSVVSINTDNDLRAIKNKINNDEETTLKSNLLNLVTTYTEKADAEKVKNTPNKIITKALAIIEEVDPKIVYNLPSSDKDELLLNLEKILAKISEIKSIVNDD